MRSEEGGGVVWGLLDLKRVMSQREREILAPSKPTHRSVLQPHIMVMLILFKERIFSFMNIGGLYPVSVGN